MKKKSDKFILKLEKLCIDSEIKKDIIYKIQFYEEYSKLYIKDNVLYGTYINKCDLNRATPAKEFLEIKIFDNNLICNYSEDSNRRIINIIQNTLKGGHTRVCKKIETKGFTYNQNNKIDIEQTEEIFNYQNELIYKSNLNQQSDYDTYPERDSNIIYATEHFDNYMLLEREWYTPEGVKLKYKLTKSFNGKNDKINENYLICKCIKCSDTGIEYRYEDINRETFKEFMAGKICIHEVFDRVGNSKRLKL